MAAKLVVNELLCYAFAYANKSTIGSLSSCLSEFYKPDEISDARNVLWSECEAFLTNHTRKTRRTQAPVDKQTALPFADDIGTWINILKNLPDPMAVKFCALDIQNMPPCSPEETNLFSIVARVTALEKKMDAVMSTTSTSTSEGSSFPEGFGGAQTSPKAVARSSAGGSSMPDPSAEVMETMSSNLAEPWNKVAGRKRRNPQQQQRRLRAVTKSLPVVVGRASSNSVIRGSKPLKPLFIYGVDSAVTTDALKEFLTGKGIQPKQVWRVSKETWLRASFKVTLEEEDAEKCSQAEFWPEGIRCREWLRSVPKTAPKTSNPLADADSVPTGDDADEPFEDGGLS